MLWSGAHFLPSSFNTSRVFSGTCRILGNDGQICYKTKFKDAPVCKHGSKCEGSRMNGSWESNTVLFSYLMRMLVIPGTANVACWQFSIQTLLTVPGSDWHLRVGRADQRLCLSSDDGFRCLCRSGSPQSIAKTNCCAPMNNFSIPLYYQVR